MKTIEQKAQSYDEALKRAREYHKVDYDNTMKLYAKGTMEYLFPELKESEDEKIRKWLIGYFNQYTIDGMPVVFSNGLHVKDITAWLEKQCNVDKTSCEISEQENDANAPTEYGKYVDECLNEASKHFFSEGEDKYSVADLFYAGVKCGKSWCEKQGESKQDPCKHCKRKRLNCHNFPCIEKMAFEQGKSAFEAINEEKADNSNRVEPKDYSSIDPHFAKPADKVEPKFEIGDTIINIYHRCDGNSRIREITDGKYIFDDGSYIVIKEQDSWELVDRNKSKFKVGDWVVSELDNTCYQIKKCILNVTNNKYGYDLTSGGYISSQDVNFYHLWTIQDAKDGDLIYVSTEEKGIQAIFREYKNKTIFFHCYLCGDFVQGGYMPMGSVELVYPLQKVHYTRFFQKMKEAGYEWDDYHKRV